jgi:peptidoglycan hydrolase CwlO-like protein
MEKTTVNKIRKVEYAAVDFAESLSDLTITVRKPDGSLLAPAPTVTEQGDGVYEFSYTPDVVGLWQERVVSAVNGDKAYHNVDVVAVDLDDVDSKVDGVETKVDNVQSTVNTVDGKVDTVDGKVDSVQNSVNTVDGKVDSVDGKVDSVQTSVDSVEGKVDQVNTKIDNIDGQIKPGGYFL